MDTRTVRGAMLGLAVGDALGVPVEFLPREALAAEPVTGMRAYGTHHQSAGTWSDDTSMALCLLESLTGGLDYEDMMLRFRRWAREGYLTAHGVVFDMGIATHEALRRFDQGTPALLCGGTGERDNGNGSLMRILPLALYLHAVQGPDFCRRPESYEIIHNASALTHAHPISRMACGLFCAAAGALLDGVSVWKGIEIAKEHYQAIPELEPWLEKVFWRVERDVLPSLRREEIASSGFVVHTLEAALWCLLRHGNYRDTLLEAVNLGEDTDTTGAVAGGLAGLVYGPEGIPEDWLAVLAGRADIEALCDAFAGAVSAKRP